LLPVCCTQNESYNHRKFASSSVPRVLVGWCARCLPWRVPAVRESLLAVFVDGCSLCPSISNLRAFSFSRITADRICLIHFTLLKQCTRLGRVLHVLPALPGRPAYLSKVSVSSVLHTRAWSSLHSASIYPSPYCIHTHTSPREPLHRANEPVDVEREAGRLCSDGCVARETDDAEREGMRSLRREREDARRLVARAAVSRPCRALRVADGCAEGWTDVARSASGHRAHRRLRTSFPCPPIPGGATDSFRARRRIIAGGYGPGETEPIVPASSTAFGAQMSRRVRTHSGSFGPRLVRRCTLMLNIMHLACSAYTCSRASYDPVPHKPSDDECRETGGHPQALSWHAAVDDGPAGRYK
jgi:hypothetical protein